MNIEITTVVAVASVVSAFIGWVTTAATFRGKIGEWEVKFTALKEQVDRDRANDQRTLAVQIGAFTDSLRRIERQSDATLRLIANMAHGTGADRRTLGEDVLSRYLAEDESK